MASQRRRIYCVGKLDEVNVVTALLAILFLAMIAAPCVVALRSTPKSDPVDEIEAEEIGEEMPQPILVAAPYVPEPEPFYVEAAEAFEPAPRRVSLQRLAEEAEREALVAEDWARKAHWAALDAAARAAALRADAAAEAATLAGRAAERAIRAAEAEFGEHFLDEMHIPSHHPGSRRDRRAA